MAILRIESFRVLRGSAFGVMQSTLLMSFNAITVPSHTVRLARNTFSRQLPKWIPAENGDAISDAQQAVSLFAELVLGLQLEAGVPISRSFHVRKLPMLAQTKGTSIGIELALPSAMMQASKVAIDWALAAVNSQLSGVSGNMLPSVESAVKNIPTIAGAGINRFFIFEAIHQLQIPCFEPVEGLIVLGTGKRSRWLNSLSSDLTPNIGVVLAKDKSKTARMLRLAGLPGATNGVVKDALRAVEAANKLGYPVVVKPVDADRGLGVAADLRCPEDVALAFDAAKKISPRILVEKWVAGYTHRLTVQDASVIRVVKRVAGGVIGDGTNTITRLVETFQKTPQQQRMARHLGRNPLSLDDEAITLLAQAEINVEYVPKLGQYIKLRRRDNVNAGATNIELNPTDALSVHPDNIRLAIEAAGVLRLDFAGIDLIMTDIGQSWMEIGGLICEVNSSPQMGGRQDPYLYQRLLKRMFPNGPCVPAELKIMGSNSARLDEVRGEILRSQPDACVSTAKGLWINGQCATAEYPDSFEAARGLLQRREAGSIVCLMSIQDLYDSGLPMPYWEKISVDDKQYFFAHEAALLLVVAEWLKNTSK